MLAATSLSERPVYFVSSNTHSLVNVLSGVAAPPRKRAESISSAKRDNPELLPELEKLEAGRQPVTLGKSALFRRPPLLCQHPRVERSRKRAHARKS